MTSNLRLSSRETPVTAQKRRWSAATTYRTLGRRGARNHHVHPPHPPERDGATGKDELKSVVEKVALSDEEENSLTRDRIWFQVVKRTHPGRWDRTP